MKTSLTPATKTPARRRKATCSCPACSTNCYNHTGVWYCLTTKDHTAYYQDQTVSSHTHEAQAVEALGVFTRNAIAQASRIAAIETAAAESDLSHDIAQASTDADVVAALAPQYTLRQVTTAESGRAGIDLWVEIQNSTFKAFYMSQDCGFFPTEADAITYLHNRAIAQVTAWQTMKADAEIHRLNAAVHAANAALPEAPPYIHYSSASQGFIWASAPTAYNSYTEAAIARDGRL